MKCVVSITFLFYLFVISYSVIGQNRLLVNNSKPRKGRSWNVILEKNNKVFIENNGQFEEKDSSLLGRNDILFGTNNSGVEVYFTRSGLTYKYVEIVKESDDEQGKQIGREEEEKYKLNTYFLCMQWVGSNPNTQIKGEEVASNYFTYSDLRGKSGKSSIKANAFKKIIYKNIYPNIDIEYSFPENKSGIKYSIILHPGADSRKIKMQYDGSEKIETDADGDVKVESKFGEFIDHAPVSYFVEGGGKIKSSFISNHNTVLFQLDVPNNISHQTIIIDPWTTIPEFTGTNKAYDIDWDYRGNVYIYGGQDPYQLSKIDSTGLVQWTFTNSPSSYKSYGDFAIDRNNGVSYICGGTYSPILKVSSNGSQVNSGGGVAEMWRIAFNSCTHQGVIGCGSFHVPFQAAVFDTNLNVTPVNVLNTGAFFHDITILALDDSNCYMATARMDAFNDGLFDNVLVKCPSLTLSPTLYMVQDGYSFVELAGITYYQQSIMDYSNGFNGMAKSPEYLYTYDGAVLKKWNPKNGMIISSVRVNANSFQCGGITVDGCNNVYVGTLNGVAQYNSALSFVKLVATPNVVYDIALESDDKIIACGLGFVSKLDSLSPCASTFSVSTNNTNACLGNGGTATAIVTGGSPPFVYQWTPGGQTTQTATGLSAGAYQVIVSEKNGIGCRNITTQTATVTITSQPTPTVNITSSITSPLTYGQSATLTANGANSYNWDNGSNGNIITVTPTITTAYCVSTLDSNNCFDTACITIDFYDMCASGIYLPNAFSPNNDGDNDFLQVYYENVLCVTSFHIIIYDRWGENLFESSDPTFKWDGSYIGETMNTQVLTYSMRATLINGKVADRKGNISLVR